MFYYVNALRKIRKSVNWNFENIPLIGEALNFHSVEKNMMIEKNFKLLT